MIVFPVGWSCVAALPWTPPIADIASFATSITAWARSPNAHFWEAATGWAWVKDWPSVMLAHRPFISKASWSFAMVVGIGIAIALVDRILIKAGRLGSLSGPGRSIIVYAILISCLGNLFWFLTAPDPRFGIGFMLVMPALLLAAGMRGLSVDGPLVRCLVNHLVLFGFIFVCAGLFVKHQWAIASKAINTWPSIPYVPVAQQDFGLSLLVHVPIKGDQCWDAPRPCAPARAPDAIPLSDHRLLLWQIIKPSRVASSARGLIDDAIHGLREGGGIIRDKASAFGATEVDLGKVTENRAALTW